MSLPRRGFVKTGILSAVSAGIVASNPGIFLGQSGKTETTTPIPIEAEKDPVFYFTQESFANYVGDIFTASDARGGLVSLKLVAVNGYVLTESAKTMSGGATQPRTFSLTFASSAELPRFTSIHKMNHPRMGDFDLFLRPTQNEDGTYSYEAVISHF